MSICKVLKCLKEHSLSTMKINHEILEQHCTVFPTMRGGHEKRPVDLENACLGLSLVVLIPISFNPSKKGVPKRQDTFPM